MENRVEQVFLLEDILKIVYEDGDWKNSFQYFFEQFKKINKEIDYMALEEYRQIIGKLGEKYVLEKEIERLEKVHSSFAKEVDGSPALNGRNGYDILSYTADGNPIYIEVKSTTGNWDEPFYIKENERSFAEFIRKKHGIYQIHRVFNIGKNMDVIVFDNEEKFQYGTISYVVNIV